ncbi:MAG: hypothetical protein E7186_06740 [Erysipelotrichaceae bacterium]|nr:hypothetical protein [Erysipelotrichaceae bacterium]
MRLIDADKVRTIIVDVMWDADDLPHDEQQAVLRACYSIMERIEKRATVVKAIPIEWIKNYASHKASKDLIDCYWHFWEDDVLKMVADWEEENEA